MKLSEATTYCSPGDNWAACEAQRWNCTPELIEATVDEATRGEGRGWLGLHYTRTLKALGLKCAAYCEDCGRQYEG